ncbi:MAG: 30S ribosomal protein S24e [Candidatus Micrarchaeaceae archaeon]
MELEIISKKENVLFKRKEILFSIEGSAGTTRRNDVKAEICKRLNLSPEYTIVVRIDQGFGSKKSTGVAHSYDSKETMETYEQKHVLARVSKGATKQNAQVEKAEGKEAKAEEAK